MREFLDCVITQNGAAFGTGVLLFLLTIILASRRVIGFFLTIVLLALALGASVGVKHRKEVRAFIREVSGERTAEAKVDNAKNKTAKLVEQIEKAYGDIKSELHEQKEQLETYFKAANTAENDANEQQGEQQQR